MKRNVYLFQINNTFGRNAFLPYSVGLLQAYALSVPEIRSEYEFKGFGFLREDIRSVVNRMERPDVAAFSLYIWSSEYTKALARAVKEAYPNCLIILGGPHVPVRSEGYFSEHPWADILIHYEGEVTFAEVLKNRLEDCDEEYRYPHVEGISVNWHGETMKTLDRERLADLDSIPSPYLTGVFDDLMRMPYDFHATQETHRGCLVGGTEVVTAVGIKVIEYILPGEEVLGWDEEKNHLIWNRIERNIYTGEKEVLRITAGGQHVEATGDHPFYTKRGWVRADEINEGDEVLCGLWEAGSRSSEQDLFVCLRPDLQGTQNAGNQCGQEEESSEVRLQDVWEEVSEEWAGDLLPEMQLCGKEGMACGEAEGNKALLQGLRRSITPRIAENKWKLSKYLFGEVLAGSNQQEQDREFESSKTTGSPQSNLGHRESDGSRTLREDYQTTSGREDQLLPSSRERSEQVRETTDRFPDGEEPAVSVRGVWGFLGGSVSVWTAEEPRFYSREQQGQASDSCSRALLASESEKCTERVGGLQEQGVELPYYLGGHHPRRSDGEQNTGVCWVKVTSIKKIGTRKAYDLVNAKPYPNFFANGILVHNCPYSCTFCDWGSNTLAKVKSFGTERLVNEFEWMAKHRIDLLYNADANYAMLPRDLDLTERMVKVKEKYGFPNKFRAAYAKNSNEKVFQVARLLNKAGMNKGITLSFQSMDDNTLQIVKRKNIKVKDFQSLIRHYRKEGIATYSELIIGLPGESYNTFADGINTLIDAGQHDSLQVYTCLAGDTLVNTLYGQIPIKELAERRGRIPIPSYDPSTGQVITTDAFHPRKTGENKKLLRVTVRGPFGDRVDCTPDHRFLWISPQCNDCGQRDIAEKQAQELQPGDTVAALTFVGMRMPERPEFVLPGLAPAIAVVESVTELPGLHDVYCMEVPETGWFFAENILVHNCECLPNSEMSHPEYRKLHEIKTVHTPVLHFHATPSDDPHPEFYELVIGTKTLSEEDWMRCQLFAWATQAFHCLGLTQSIAVFLRHYLGINYRRFYEVLLDFADHHPWTIIGRAYRDACHSFCNLKYGLEWGYRNPEFGDIVWPVEEGGFLSCCKEASRFYVELALWLQDAFGLETLLLNDLLIYQEATAKLPNQQELWDHAFRYNLHEFLEGCYTGESVELNREDSYYDVVSQPYTDLKQFAKEVVWYGRKGGKFKNEVRRAS